MSHSRRTFDESYHKSNKRWVDKGSKFYKWIIKSWLQGNNISMSSKHNEAKYLVANRFIRTLKNKCRN